jgi:hypothetical protein
METKKYRITIAERINISSVYYSHVEFDSFDDFTDYLKSNGISNFCLKYHSIIDDIPSFYEMGLTVNTFTQKHFDWLIEESYGQSKYLEK